MLTREDILNYALALPPGDREQVAAALQGSLQAEQNQAESLVGKESYEELQRRFADLTREWKQATAFTSSATSMAMHPAYQDYRNGRSGTSIDLPGTPPRTRSLVLGTQGDNGRRSCFASGSRPD